ncbi:MAG: discoidin domain-containing protein [Massilia sp.]|uniref:discoidin domain-containing protein n=1 Tax=Massilia sp. TaxID=1882437 RepID=UPI002FC8C620
MNNFQQSPILKRIHAYGGMTLVAAALGIGNVNAQSINLAANRPAMASSFQTSTMVPASVVDGDPKTRWSSTFSNTEWIQIDLGSVQSFNSVLLDWETAFARAYSLQVSTNGSAWTTVFSTKTGLGGAERIDFPATNARFVRMVGTQRATNWGYSLIEFKVSNEPKRTVVAAVNPLPTDAIFAPTSFWYQVIPTNVTLHPNSAMFTADVERQIKAYYGNVTINTTSYASPVYVAPANTPTAAVRFWDCQNKRYTDSGLVQQWSAVPMPTHAQPAVGTDSEMTVYQPSTDTIWEFWLTRNQGGVWQACWGGRLQNASKSSGIFPGSYGTTATGLPFLGGQITAEELQRGEIRHAIGISLVELASWNVFSWPAQRSDGYNPNNVPNRIAEGQRFRLDPSINVDALNIHPVAKTIAKAAQKYGFVVWDKAGSVSLRAQNPKSYTALGQPNPYNALFNGTAEYNVLKGFPWNRLQFLPMNYGKP